MTLMTSDVDALHEPRAAGAPGRALTGPLLIAARDDDSARGALRVAELLARRDRVNGHVLTLVQPLPFTASLLTNADAAALSDGRRRKQLARVRQRVHQTVGRSAYFSTDAEDGSPAHAMARAVDERSTLSQLPTATIVPYLGRPRKRA